VLYGVLFHDILLSVITFTVSGLRGTRAYHSRLWYNLDTVLCVADITEAVRQCLLFVDRDSEVMYEQHGRKFSLNLCISNVVWSRKYV